jgi:hypothetical protein
MSLNTRSIILFATLLVLGSTACIAQGTQDPQALSTLNSCITTSGGLAAINAVQDFAAQSNITYYWANQNVQGTATLKALGTSNFRVDAVLQAGTRSWAVTGLTGALVNTDGTRTTIPSYNAVNVGIQSWRLPNIVAALGNTAANISYMGVVQSDAGQAIQVHYVLPDSSNPDPSLANLNTIDYFFDPNTFYLLETLDTTYSATNFNPSQGLQHEILFSNYQNVSGVMIPFSVSEKISGQTTWSVQLTSISFNVGLTVANFQL